MLHLELDLFLKYDLTCPIRRENEFTLLIGKKYPRDDYALHDVQEAQLQSEELIKQPYNYNVGSRGEMQHYYATS
jgi:hypothetical protein